jgi:multiple sugar transport system substrate-binding protein
MRRRTLLAGALAATPLVAACDSGGGASGSTSSGGGGRTTISYGIWDPAQLAASLPMIVLYLFLQRHFVQGIAQSGTKG